MQGGIRALAAGLHRDLSDAEASALAGYADLVQAWNARVNLTAARSPDALVEVLCTDALVLAGDDLVPRHARVVDVGSGAGAPVLPLLVLRNDLSATLVEPLRKRVAFLRTAIGSLDLAARAAVIEGRAEPGRPIPGAPFDVAMSRATLAPSEWLALGASLAPCVLVLTAQESPPPAPPGWAMRSVDYTAPGTGAPRRITQYRSCSGEENA